MASMAWLTRSVTASRTWVSRNASNTGTRRRSLPTLSVHRDVAFRSGGAAHTAIDIWFLPAFADSHLCFREAFSSSLVKWAQVFAFDPPGHGASPPRPRGLTIQSAARIWRELIARFSASRLVVLVGHSMAGIIASHTARLLARPPALVISVEGNLTRADAYFTGRAVQYDTPDAFYASFRSRIRRRASGDESVRRFARSLEFADATTLWRLVQSVVGYSDSGGDLVRLQCPKIHYWNPASSSKSAQPFLDRRRVPQRRLDGLGHWPMVKSSRDFHATIEHDIRTTRSL